MNTPPLPHLWTVDTPDVDIKNKLYVDWRILSQQAHLLVVKTGQAVEAGQRFQTESRGSVHCSKHPLPSERLPVSTPKPISTTSIRKYLLGFVSSHLKLR